MSFNSYRFFNKYQIGISAVFCLSLFVAFFFTGLYDTLFNFNFNAPDIAADPYAAQQLLLKQHTSMNCYTSDIYPYVMMGLPILCFSLSILFFHEKNGLFQYRYTRSHSYKRVVLTSMFTRSFVNSLYFYLSFIIYFTFGYFFFGSETNLVVHNFDGLFGTDFCLHHTYLYYMLEGFIIYFLASFVFTWLACSVAMLTNRIHNIILIPSCIYFGLSLIIGYVFSFSLGSVIVDLFQPFKFVFVSLIEWEPKDSIFNIFKCLAPLSLPLLIAIILTVITLRKDDKVDD